MDAEERRIIVLDYALRVMEADRGRYAYSAFWENVSVFYNYLSEGIVPPEDEKEQSAPQEGPR